MIKPGAATFFMTQKVATSQVEHGFLAIYGYTLPVIKKKKTL
jgi:hypothetical protein